MLCEERCAAVLPSLGSAGSGGSPIRSVPELPLLLGPRCPRAPGALRGTLGVCPFPCIKYTGPAGCCNSEVSTDTNKRLLT